MEVDLGRLREHDQRQHRAGLVEQRHVDLLDDGARAASSRRRLGRCGDPRDRRGRRARSTTPTRRPATPRSSSGGTAGRARRRSSGRRDRGPRSPRAGGRSPPRCAPAGRRCRTSTTPAPRRGRDPARRRPDTRHATEACGDADRAAGVGAERAGHEAAPPSPRRCRRSTRRRSARGPTGCVPGRNAGSSSIAPSANSCVFSLPTITAPADAQPRYRGRVRRSGTLSARIRDAAVVGVPATSITSLTATGRRAEGRACGRGRARRPRRGPRRHAR